MTSELKSLFVWIWLPDQSAPVVAGQVISYEDTGIIYFGYGGSYLRNPNAIPIFTPDLPLQEGLIDPSRGHLLAPALRDALPDRWGRRVIINEVLGHTRDDINEDALDELTFMIKSGSDRIGALDFQESADTYVPRLAAEATLEELQNFSDLIEAGQEVPKELDRVILHGSSIGGARPKALIADEHSKTPRKLIAKFSATNDVFAMVKGEFATMRMAKLAGMDVAHVDIERVLERDVLLVERFDRKLSENDKDWQRRAMISALSWTGENELAARHVSYTELAEIIRARFRDPTKDLRELFARMTFNILVGNTDDHARNHAAFWDGEMLELTPAYDIAPQQRGGGDVNQALNIVPGERSAQLVNVLKAAAHFHIGEPDVRDIIDHQIAVICDNWRDVCDLAGMGRTERTYFEGRQVLNSYAFEGYGPVPKLANVL